MNTRNNFFICSFVFFLTFLGQGQVASGEPHPIKIACVGNSITYGARIQNLEKNAYPAQLQNLLGTNYMVKNFGVSGTTLLKKGNRPYWKAEEYQKALAFDPDIVFIKLGTNDSKSQNRVFLDKFEADYRELIGSFKIQNKDLRIVLLLPIPAFIEDSTRIWNPVIKNTIIPATQQVAYETQNEVIDLYHLFVNRPELLPDKIHPSDLGASVIAQRLYEVVMRNPVDKSIDLTVDGRIEPSKETSFYGFPLTQFKFNGVECMLARPKKVAEGMPWVLRARFWGHEPQTDIALLERGFHIAYCDVANLYGNQEAVARWNSFYRMLTQAGLSKKVALEGMSRGGLIIYNWAEQNPEKVACIYADAPVLDGKSWPGGLGNGKGSPEDWERFKKVYNLKNDAEIASFKGNPIHKAASIAAAGYPMLHICGETDEVVPIAENTVLFAQGIQENGGNIETVYKPDNGHHPHSLPNPTPIVDFILRATGQIMNFATIPSPSAEYRSGAGWTEGADWWTQANDIDSLCQSANEIDLLLIGNSITQGFGGNRPHVTNHPGKVAADEYFKDLKWVNAGISGDRTQHILWRLQNGSYEKAMPKTVVLTIGVNNFPFENAAEIVDGIRMVLQNDREKFPDSNIMLFGPLPTGTKSDSKQREKFREVHKALGEMDFDDNVSYHEISKLVLDTDGNLNPNFYSEDGIHLKPKGYKVWAKYIRQQIKNKTHEK